MRTRTSATALALIVLVSGVCAHASAQQTQASKINEIFAPLADRHSPGMAVLVRKNGRPLFQHGYGVRDLRTLSPIDAQTDFRLASCTKQFTVMAIMLLIRDGKLRYDETLTQLFPEFPAYGRRITIRHLLTHTSGLPDYETLMQAAEKTNGRTWTPGHQIQDAQVLSLLEQQSAAKFERRDGVSTFRRACDQGR